MVAAYLRFTGLSIVATAISAITGQLRGVVWMYSWNSGSVGMAIPTACCMLLIGVGFFMLSRLPAIDDHA